MSILRLLPGPHISEFAPASDGRHFNGTCTQSSAAMAYAALKNAGMSQQACIDLMVSMRDAQYARGDNPDSGCATNGASTVKSMAYELRQRGAVAMVEWDFAGDALPEDWHTLIKEHAGVNPILLQVSNAQGLSDVSGAKEDAGVHYHAIYVAGIAQEGYVIYDPNNPTVMHSGDIYTFAALQAASPCGLIMLAAPTVPGVPNGWTDDGATLTAPNGVPVVNGFRAHVLASNWRVDDYPIEGEHATDFGPDLGAGSEQFFRLGALGWTEKQDVFDVWTGAGMLALRQQVTDLQAQVAQLQQSTLDKTTLQGVLTDLQDAMNKVATITK